MNLTEHDLSILASDFSKSTVTKTTQDLLRQAVEQGLSARLMAILILPKGGEDQSDSISRVMASLEMLAATDRSVACILMSELKESANDAKMHDICDAIDLWLWDTNQLVQKNPDL